MRLSTRFCGATFVFLVSGVAAVWADTTLTVLYVNKANQTGVENGLSWATAFSTIQPAIDAAVGHSQSQVWITQGVYDERRHATLPSRPENSGSLTLASGIPLYGGFVGNELSLLERAAGTYSTIDGSTAADGAKAQHVIMGADGSSLNGFVIKGGMANIQAVRNYGGGLWHVSGEMALSNCVFRENAAVHWGGAIYAESGLLRMQDCLFEENVNQNNSGSAIAEAGADIQCDRCVFRHNTSLSSDGLFVGSVMDGLDGSINVRRCLFEANVGGIVTADRTAVTMDSSVIKGNGGASVSVGVAEGFQMSFVMRNCLVEDNVGNVAGVVFTRAEEGSSAAEIDSCTVAGNQGGEAGCVYVQNGSLCNVRRSILWDNGAQPLVGDLGATINVFSSDIQGGYEGAGNIGADPLFRDPDSGDYSLYWTSPCIDSGDPDGAPVVDLVGISRPQYKAVDMGAYEFAIQDGDGDGMDDTWETRNGLNPLDGSDGALDLDSDGMSNLEEYLARTDPKDPLDPLSSIYVSTTGDDSTGDGEESAPLRTIGAAMAMAAQYSIYRPATIYLGPGEYEEPVHLAPFVTLVGAGSGQTTIQYYSASDDEHIVVTGAEGAALRDCTVTLPDFYAVSNLLLRLSDAAMMIDNVVFDGNDNLYSLGALITGPDTSPSVMRDCVFRRLHFGVQAVNSGVNITETLFEGIRGDAVFVRLPDGYKSGSVLTPLLGDAALAGTTGQNQFRMVTGALVVNMSPESTRAENNDWGYYSKEEIQKHVMGSVDYEPFLCDGPCTGEGEGEGESEGEGEGEGHGSWDCFGTQ